MHAEGKGEKIMFTYIELENFKSFGKINFDFKNTQKDFKRFVAIYGENGSGKSNFVSSVELLSRFTTSFVNQLQIEEYKKLYQTDADKKDFLKKILFDIDSTQITSKLKEYRMLESVAPTKVTYGFSIKDIEGYYSVSFDESSIIEEKLYYMCDKQRGVLYHIIKDKDKIHKKFSSALFNTKKYEKDFCEIIDMYWGKHTLLALVLNEKRTKNYEYVSANISSNLLEVLETFMHVFILCKPNNKTETGIICGSNILVSDFEQVVVKANDKKKANQIKKIEKIIKSFFTQAYTDIIDACYEISKEDEKNIYTLVFKKMISGKVRTIPFKLESAGTQRILKVLRALIEVINGQTVVYDEIDDGIHDLLMCNVLLSVQDEIKGQLIITTHNTLLLEDLNPKSAYVIYMDSDGNKEARCIDDYDIRIQSSNNQRKLYLNGVFGGIPYTSDIDYSDKAFNFSTLEE